MPAEAGIQGREGMDTGFRRYDGSLVPIRHPVRTSHVFSKEHTKGHEVRKKERCFFFFTFVYFVPFVVISPPGLR